MKWKRKFEELQKKVEEHEARLPQVQGRFGRGPRGLGSSRSSHQGLALRRAHTYSGDDIGVEHADGGKDYRLDIPGSLGLCALIAHMRGKKPYNAGSATEEEEAHHATVSFADDGSAGVGAAAAAAVSIALAKSWASVPSQRESMYSMGKARYKLVAAVPKNTRFAKPARTDSPFREGDKISASESEDRIPFDSMDDHKEAEWVACGSHLKLQWLSSPKNILVIFKPSEEVFETAIDAIVWLLKGKFCVYVEPNVFGGIIECLKGNGVEQEVPGLKTWHVDECGCSSVITEQIAEILDLVVTIGGDGTVLWACSVMGTMSSVPPIVPIAMGSLGFMTPFPRTRMTRTLERITSPLHPFPIMLRHRLQCRIMRGNGSSDADLGQYNRVPCGEDVLVLNEIVIDRGMAACLTNLECYVDSNFMTNIQGDGLIVSTPTGSTAYNLAAGGSMVHPAVPCILFTPICPHSLSARPLVFPEHVSLRLKVPLNSRGTLYCSFDGKARQPLHPGDSVFVHLSQFPVPMVCNLDASHDWFMSVRDGLHWNRRNVQK